MPLKMKRQIIIAILLVLLVGGLVSCRKNFEEINTNPNTFNTATDGSLFNSVVSTLQLGWNEQFYLNNEILYKQTQLAALTKEAWGNYTIATEEIWSNYYTALPAVRELEKRFGTYAVTSGTNNMKAMLMVIKALKTFKVTDLFGDIPYSQAGYGFQTLDYLHPNGFGCMKSFLIHNWRNCAVINARQQKSKKTTLFGARGVLTSLYW